MNNEQKYLYEDENIKVFECPEAIDGRSFGSLYQPQYEKYIFHFLNGFEAGFKAAKDRYEK